MSHICSSRNYIILSLNNTIISFHSIQTFSHLFSIDALFNITALETYNDTFIIIGFEESKYMLINVFTLQTYTFDMDSYFVSFKKDSNDNVFYGLDASNQIFILNLEIDAVQNDVEVVMNYKCKSTLQIKTWCCVDEHIVFIDSEGYLKIYKANELVCDFLVKKCTFTDMKPIERNIYALVSTDGCLRVIDITKESIICEEKVRDTALYALNIIDNKIFCAGVDNRLACFLFRDSKLYSNGQTDTHQAAVRRIHININRIITLSDDRTISVHQHSEMKYVFRTIIPHYNLLRTVGNAAYLNDCKNISCYDIDMADTDNMFDELGFYANNYKALPCLNIDDNILIYDVNKEYIAYSTHKETVLCSINNPIDCRKVFEPSSDLAFFKHYLCFTNLKKMLCIYNSKSSEISKEIILESFSEKLIILIDYILIRGKNMLIDMDLNCTYIQTDYIIEHAVQAEDKIYFIGYFENFKINTTYVLNCYDLKDNAVTLISSLEQVIRIDGMIFFDNKLIYHDIQNLFIYNLGNGTIERHFTGKYIMGLSCKDNGLILAHKPVDDVLKYDETNKKLKIKWIRKFSNN